MKASVAARLTIRASAAEVFFYLKEVESHPLWNPRLQSVSPLKTLRLGSTYTSENTLLGIKVTSSNTVTKFTANKEFEIKNDAGILHYTANYKLAPKDKQTIVICNTEVYSDKDAFRLAAPMLKLLARREIQTDLHLLKLVVEDSLMKVKA